MFNLLHYLTSTESDMLQLTQDMKDMLNQAQIWILATVDQGGIPNAVAINWYERIDDRTVMLIDNCMKKTTENIRHNPNVAITVWLGNKGYQFKGKARIENKGPIFDEAVHIVKAAKPMLKPKNVVIVEIDKVYFNTNGEQSSALLTD